METERDRARANVEALGKLIEKAEPLRRRNASKWQRDREAWVTAIRAIQLAPTPHPNDSVSFAQAILAAQSAGRRLGDSGEARFDAASVGREPDSCSAGSRFDDDLCAARLRLLELEQLLNS